MGFRNPGGVWILHPQELERGRGKASASAEPERALGCPHRRGDRDGPGTEGMREEAVTSLQGSREGKEP